MARFSGEHQAVLLVKAPLARVAAGFSDLDRIVRCYGPLERSERADEETLRFWLMPKTQRGISFKGNYSCRYRLVSPELLTWSTVATGNMWSTGSARFEAVEPARTRVTYAQKMEGEMELSRLLAPIARPIVAHEMREGIRAYLERMVASVEREG